MWEERHQGGILFLLSVLTQQFSFYRAGGACPQSGREVRASEGKLHAESNSCSGRPTASAAFSSPSLRGSIMVKRW